MENRHRSGALRARRGSEDSAEENAFRRLLTSEFAAGMFSFIPSEAIVDIVGYAGFDFLIFDTEHASYDVAMIERLARAADAVGIASVVRISHPDPYLIARVLDTGVHGLMFARISSRREAEEIVSSSRLAPLGKRGSCPGMRAGQYFLMPRDEYTRRSNDVAIVVMIETKEGLEDAEGILSVDGIDGVAVGPVDLSYSLGVGSREAPEVAEAIAHVTRLARAKGKGVMASAKTLDELAGYLKRKEGPRVFWYTTDAYQIGNCFRELMRKSHELVAEHALA
jgi:4-hydroxy-2-oxoheptanedioate aldolase